MYHAQHDHDSMWKYPAGSVERVYVLAIHTLYCPTIYTPSELKEAEFVIERLIPHEYRNALHSICQDRGITENFIKISKR